MSEEVLWYIARISGLMAWILSFGALAAGLLARAEPTHGTTAGLWAAETRNLLGRLSVVALLAHGAATASADRFGLDLQSVLTGRTGGQWLVTAAVVGVISGWAIVAMELVRLALRRLSSGADLALLIMATGIVAGGAYHGWQIGSDTQNPLAIAVVVLSGLLLIGAAAIGLTSLLDGQDPLDAAPPAITAAAEGENLMLSDVSGDTTLNGPQTFDAELSVSPSRTFNGDQGGLAPKGASEPYRGPQISSARDVSGPDGMVNGNADEGEIPGAWSMRKLPDAPKPAHRKPGKS